jgi:hypothetical protein
MFLLFLIFVEQYLLILTNFSMSPWQILNSVDFSTLFFFSSVTFNGNFVFRTLFVPNAENIYFIILMFILLYALIVAINAALITKTIIYKNNYATL